MMNDPITKVMQDASEIVRYDEVGIPLYYPGRTAFFLSGSPGALPLA